MQDDLTTLVCLFHHEDQAQAAVRDLRNAGITESAISTIGGDGSGVDALDKSELSSLGMPDRDYDRLKEGLRRGGIVVAVSSISDHVSKVESVFGQHRAEKIDEAETGLREPAPLAAAVPAASEGAIPIVEEDLVVGKRTVDQGGVRLYQRVVEIPVEESIQLREEHVNVDRIPTDRAVTDADRAFQERSIELTETAEEAVVAKDARVVEEVILSKNATEHTETVRDTVRHTEVEIDELPGTGATAGKTTSTY
ncbi:YsnF/AvaK domain-containing protein [Terriglobus sp.]|uniref:YsnF/AvaK domain-containing protein n=1 Tax=Terriglobus sp. TaxID=1889013 RepID=UPI003AFFCD11